MGERYRLIFFAILALIVVWFLIIFLCLPEDDNVKQWTTDSSSVKLRKDNNKIGSNKYRRNHEIQPPKSLEFMKHFQSKHRSMSNSDTLFYQFDPIHAKHLEFSGSSSPSISKDQHNKLTLELGLVDNPTDQYVKSEGHRLFAFNLLVSNRIGLIRQLPDTRHKKCLKTNPIDTTTPNNANGTSTLNTTTTIKFKASIIICYYNEAPSALLRTVYTVLKHSPHQLIQEIIVVDDFSNQEYHYNKIQPFISSNLVKLIRTAKREGLIRARLFGAKIAKGDVLVFLDSHVEANVGWLEPLLKIVKENKTTIGCPMIDLINAETLIYSSSPMVKGGLNWNLNFKWDSIPSNKLKTYDDFIKPIESPTMAGGLYAINREFFYQIGEYDSGMELWGGENVELSLRTWMCGGRILILPCSRLGHIFRKRRPYGLEPGQADSLLINSHRTARVWLEDYIYKFYEANPDARYLFSGNVSHRLELKHKLGCQNFSWFLENVYPNLKEELDNTSNTAEDAKLVPKILNLNQKRVNRSINWQFSRMNMVDGVFTNNRLQKHASHYHKSNQKLYNLESQNLNSSRSINSDKFKFRLFGSKHSYLTKMVSQFQIQTAGSNFCVESKGGFLAKGFSRLILNNCAEVKKNQDGEFLISNSNILDQLWTETEFHDYRLGDDQCLDLIKNLPLLRKCHNMGSFQSWTHNNQTIDTNIYNYGGSLCLGVERVQVGEPIIVTICDRQIMNEEHDLSTKLKRKTRRLWHEDSIFSDWRTSSSFKTSKRFKEVRMEPSQRWNLIFVNNSMSEMY